MRSDVTLFCASTTHTLFTIKRLVAAKVSGAFTGATYIAALFTLNQRTLTFLSVWPFALTYCHIITSQVEFIFASCKSYQNFLLCFLQGLIYQLDQLLKLGFVSAPMILLRTILVKHPAAQGATVINMKLDGGYKATSPFSVSIKCVLSRNGERLYNFYLSFYTV